MFHDLRFLREGDEVVIGRAEVDSYAVFPLDGAALVQRLVDGMGPREAAAWYEAEFGQSVDIDDLIGTLDALGLLAPPGDNVASEPVPVRAR